MAWSTSYLPDIDAVMTVFSGVIPAESLADAVRASLALAQRHDTRRFLADCSTLEGGHSVIDLYNMAKLLEDISVNRDLIEAIVLPQLNAPGNDVRFWQTTCYNRGFNVQVFSSVECARDWLVTSLYRDKAKKLATS